MAKAEYKNIEVDSFHEAICAVLFDRYDWNWEKPRKGLKGWFPDFRLKGETHIYIECKGNVKWDDVRALPLSKYEDAVRGYPYEVLIIPETPRREENARGYMNSFLGYLYDGYTWSYAALGRWSGKVGFCHNASSWKDRMSGQNIQGALGDGQEPDIDRDWRSARYAANGKRVSFFKRDVDSELEEWEVPS